MQYIISTQLTAKLETKEKLIKDLGGGKSKNIAFRKLQEALEKENEEYKAECQTLKDQRDEAQQKCLALEQIVRHARKEEKSFYKELENQLFIQNQVIQK